MGGSGLLKRAGLLLGSGCLLLCAAGGGAMAAPYEVVRPPALGPGDPIPPPQDPVILRVRGAVAGGDGPVELDRETLKKMGLVRYTTPNRWYPEPVTFEGVLGSALLDVVGVPEDASMLRLRALNDYVYRVPIADLREWPVMLALKLNGEYMRIRDKGPIWVVYPAHLEPELAGAAHQGKWVWQLAEITFE